MSWGKKKSREAGRTVSEGVRGPYTRRERGTWKEHVRGKIKGKKKNSGGEKIYSYEKIVFHEREGGERGSGGPLEVTKGGMYVQLEAGQKGRPHRVSFDVIVKTGEVRDKILGLRGGGEESLGGLLSLLYEKGGNARGRTRKGSRLPA